MSAPGRIRSARRKSAVGVALVAFGLILAAPSLWASCSASATGVAFGAYDVFSPSPDDSTGSVNVSCDPAAAYSITLSTGGGSYSQRELSSGGNTLGYNLYTSASRAVVWGDGTGGTGTVGGSGSGASHTVYGRIPASQNVPAGSYSDTIVVTVSF